ncbi:class I SAM-dependent methyltransferase [Christiangramia fulva]|uniref:class I SAM-dependent methyltransferase n=1 Tax=Christiangramia fulva TaxID=2126553 RepID=UPI001D055411|nr:class I SAM-dependent methyltransferase [Christiangramia fulva]
MKSKPSDKIYTDFLVSNEEFRLELWKNGILKTIPVPENLGEYYKSEDYISHTDRKVTVQEKIYQLIKRYMLNQKAAWIEKEVKKGKLLDYGCGTGDFVQHMNSRGWNSFGVEPDHDARQLAKGKSANIFSSVEEVRQEKFSVITLWHVLEHVPDYSKLLQELIQKLDKNGILVIAVPNHESFDAKYYQNFWAAWDVPRHLWHFSRRGVKEEIISQFPLKLVKEKPLIFDSFYVSLLSEKYKGNGTSFLNAIKIGLQSNLKAKTTGEYSSLAYFFQKL